MRTTLSLLLVFVMVGSLPRVSLVYGQSLTGSLIGTVKDPQGAVVPRAVGTLTSPALIGRTETSITNQQGQLRFPALPPGQYTLTVEVPGFAPYREEALRIGIGATIERTVMLSPAAIQESVAVESAGSRLDARGSVFETRFGPDDLRAIPTRRFSMFDFIRAAPATHDAAHGQRRGSLDRSQRRRQRAVLQRQALGGLGAACAAARGSACPAGAAWVQTPLFANTGRPADITDGAARWHETYRAVDGCPEPPQ